MECKSCGATITKHDENCKFCGASNENYEQMSVNTRQSSNVSTESQMSIGILILLVIVFWPAAIVYYLVKKKKI
jgi:predicted nucleic acid-binding Zn ribbon protein